jgi:hypothetical protein
VSMEDRDKKTIYNKIKEANVSEQKNAQKFVDSIKSKTIKERSLLVVHFLISVLAELKQVDMTFLEKNFVFQGTEQLFVKLCEIDNWRYVRQYCAEKVFSKLKNPCLWR